MEIKIIQIGGMKTIQFLETEPDLQGVDINAEQYQKIKELARELGWEKKVDCNLRIKFPFDKNRKGMYCALTLGARNPSKCKEEQCIFQQQLKLLKEILDMVTPIELQIRDKLLEGTKKFYETPGSCPSKRSHCYLEECPDYDHPECPQNPNKKAEEKPMPGLSKKELRDVERNIEDNLR